MSGERVGLKIGVDSVLDSARGIGKASLILSGGVYASDKMSVIEEIYQDARRGKIPEEKRATYQDRLAKLLVKLDLSERTASQVGFDPGTDLEECSTFGDDFNEMISKYQRDEEGTKITEYIALLHKYIGEDNLEKIKQASENFRANSLESFDLDLPRMGEADIVFEDGSSVKLYHFIGYKNMEEMAADSSNSRNNKFLYVFREQGFDDKTIANIAMNLNQKTLISSGAYAGSLGVSSNPGNVPTFTHAESIIIDRRNRQVEVVSSADVSFRPLDDPETENPAFKSSVKYRMSYGPRSDSGKTFEEMMSDTMGYAVKPEAGMVITVAHDGYNLPDLSALVATEDVSYEQLDEIMPVKQFSLEEVRKTFSEAFGIQRGATFSLGVEGRLVNIINDERQLDGEKPIKSLAGFPIQENHIRKLVGKLATEQKDSFRGTDISQVAKETIALVKLRSRLNIIAPDKPLPVKEDGPKFTRFSFAYEFWNKIKQIFKVFDAAKDIVEAKKYDKEKAIVDARSGALGAMFRKGKGSGFSH